MSIIQKKICDMLQEKKKESGLTMNTHNFHYSKKKKKKKKHKVGPHRAHPFLP